MFPRHLNKNFRDFEREITKSASALALRTDDSAKHVIVSKPVSNASCKKNAGHDLSDSKRSVSARAPKKSALGKQNAVIQSRSTGCAQVSTLIPEKSQNSEENVIHKEVIEDVGATVEITVKTKRKKDARNRSRSRSRVRSLPPGRGVSTRMLGGDVCRPTSDVLPGTSCPKHHSKDADRNHRPWCELLKPKESASASYCTSSAELVQVHSNHLIPGSVSGTKFKSADVIESAVPNAQLDEHAMTRAHPSSEFRETSTNDKVSNIQNDCAKGTVISSQRSEILLPPSHASAQSYSAKTDTGQYPREISTVFSVFDPVRILNFLVRELQGISRKKLDAGCVKRIARDMEETVERLPDRYRCIQCKRSAAAVPPPSKPYQSSETAPERDAPDVAALQEEIRRLEARCGQLTVDKQKMEMELAAKSKKVEAFEIKEKEYLQRICKMTEELGEMKKKNNEQMDMLTNLSKVTFQLKNENKVIVPLREAQSRLGLRLEEVNRSLEKQETELQVVKLERDKFRLLMEDKGRDVEGMKKLVKNIQFIVSEQLTNLKNVLHHKNAKDQLDSVIRAVSECSVKASGDEGMRLDASRDVQGSDRGVARPHCSSPSSSVVSSSLAISPSWQMISKISSDPDDDCVDRAPTLVLAHGSDSNVADDSGSDETVCFDDSRELQPGGVRQFGSLQSVEEFVAPVQCASRTVLTVASQVNNKPSHIGSEKAEPRPGEQRKVLDLAKNVLFHPTPLPLQFQKPVVDTDYTSDWTDYSDNG